MNTYQFEKIDIKGYRRLLSVELEMRPLNVVIGQNGIGKTSILEIFSLLASSASGRLRDTISKSGGINDILTCGKADELTFGLEMSVPNHNPLVYSLSLIPKNIGYEIKSESLTQDRGHPEQFIHIMSSGSYIRYYNPENRGLEAPNWEHSYSETSLSQVPKMYNEPEIFRKQLASCTYYSAYALNVGYNAPIRMPQKMQPSTHPGSNGEEMISYLYYLRETNRDIFETIEDTVAVAFPGFKRLNFPPVAAGTLSMTWEDEKFSKPLYMNQLSEGILRFLWLISLLQCPDLTAITLLDEPEVSLHPQLLSLLGETFREASKRTRLIVATHSGSLVKFLEPSEIISLDIEEGLAKITRADSMNLDEWLKDYNLEELWAMGRIGGRP